MSSIVDNHDDLFYKLFDILDLIDIRLMRLENKVGQQVGKDLELNVKELRVLMEEYIRRMFE